MKGRKNNHSNNRDIATTTKQNKKQKENKSIHETWKRTYRNGDRRLS